MRLTPTTAVCLFLLATGSAAHGQSAASVAVIINDADADSRRIGEYYVAERGIPAANVIRIKTSTDETIERSAYEGTIQQPIVAALMRANLVDRVLYLVLTKGVPLRIAGTGGPDGTGASVDSELTLLYRAMLGQAPLTRGRIDNPYFLGKGTIQEARPFTHRTYDIFLVSRLDAFTANEAIALIDRAGTPSTEGRIVLDQRGVPAARVGDDWLTAAAQQIAGIGQEARVILESTPDPARDVKPVLGYYSWGSGDPQNRVRNVGMGFAPGAIAATFVSTDARTFREPPPAWVPNGIAANRSGVFAGSSHSLIGDLIRGGVTGVAGHVSEPYLESVVRPDVLFAAYFAGFNLVESFYLALPHLSWQSVVVGDPLCRPFRGPDVSLADLDPDVEVSTALPSFFSRRRVRLLESQNEGMPAPAIQAWARATASLAHQDTAGGIKALEETVALAPTFVGPRFALALLYDGNKQHEQAIEHYRQILQRDPKNVVVLNNLAYHLAVRLGLPKDARPLAERAVALAPTSGVVQDTLGWIEHLLGNEGAALKLLSEAVRREPENAEIQLHAAVVYGANAARALAEAALKEALRLDPGLAETVEVKRLRERLAAP